MFKNCLLLLLLLFAAFIQAQTVSGELRKWHKVTIEFTDDATYTETGSPNPFLDRRLNVTFKSSSNRVYIVPGYFAADGNAAETSANSGNKWHVHFAPDEVGTWTYSASFREGNNVAVVYPSSPTNGTAGFIDGQNGSFTITASDKSGRDFRGKGRLQYDGTRYPKFAETGEAFIKAGPDSPENFLAYNDFDDVYVYAAPNRIKDWSAHISDWQTGDPQWQGTKGKGIIGAINYLSSVGMNSISFLTMNKPKGDTKDVTMYVDQPGQPITNYTRFDVSRIAQWEIVFEHADKKGMFLHFKTQEQENAAQLNNGNLGTERKLYYRELIARFGHHLALNWNMGEENEGSTAQSGLINSAQRIAQLKYVKDIDPYEHLRVVHSGGSEANQNAMYNPLLGNASELTGISMQVRFQDNHKRVKYWIDQSTAAGKVWPVSSDETGTGGKDDQPNRENKLYGTYFAGGYGVEYYLQSTTYNRDLELENFRETPLPEIWKKTKYALDFMKMIPYPQMEGDDSLISGNGNQCFYKNNQTYAIYLSQGNDNPALDINNTGNTYTVKWFDPRNGGALQNGTVRSITSNGTDQNIGLPPSSTSSDWVALVTNNNVSSTPEMSINNVGVTEGNNAIFTVALNNSATGNFSLNFTTVDDTATADSDYTANTGTLNFNGTAGETQTITVPTVDDALVEGNEQFIVELSNATNGVVIVDSQGIATITDNDTGASISIGDITVNEGTDVVFTLTLDNPVDGGVVVDFETADISATSGQDYTFSFGTVEFSGTANEIQTITVPTVDDGTVENNEQFVINIGTSTPSVEIPDGQALATIIDNDGASSVSIDDITIVEGGNAVMTVTLDNSVNGGVNVNFVTADGSATEDLDYTANTGTLNFNGTAGETQTIAVPTIDDDLVEGNEQFIVELSNTTNDVNISKPQGSITIVDNDEDSLPGITINNVSVEEGNNAVFSITLDKTVNGGFSVLFSTTDDSATGGSDYVTDTGTLNFSGTMGEVQTITVTIIDDDQVEGNEVFNVTLSNATANVSITNAQGSATIIDNDNTSSDPFVTIEDANAKEGEMIQFPVILSQNVTEEITFAYEFVNITTNEQDFDASPSQLTIEAGSSSAQIEVALFKDSEIEGNETFTLQITSVIQGAIANMDETATGTIFDSSVNEQEQVDMILSPVPLQSNGDLTISIMQNGEFFVSVYTLSGKSLFIKKINIENNIYTYNMNNQLSNGVYLLKLDNPNNGDSFQKRFIVMN